MFHSIADLNFKKLSDVNAGVTGIVKFLDKFYISYEESNKLDIFESNVGYQYVSSYILEKTQPGKIRDIAACRLNKCLYVSDIDYPNYCIWRITVCKNKYTVSIFAKIKDSPCAISTMSSGNVLAINRRRNGLDIYNSEGILVENLEFCADIGLQYINYALEAPNGGYLISHGYHDFRKHRVCEISADCKTIIRSHGDKCGYEQEELYKPFYLAIREEDGWIFVADTDNKRVKVMDKNLHLKDIILTEGHFPWRIFYDADMKNLIIGSSFNGVKIIPVNKSRTRSYPFKLM